MFMIDFMQNFTTFYTKTEMVHSFQNKTRLGYPHWKKEKEK